MPITPSRLTAERAVIEYTRRQAGRYVIALLGDGAGNVEVTGRDKWVWVRLEADNTQLTQAKLKSAVPLTENLAVMVERVKTNGATNYQVSGLAPVPDYPNSQWDGAVGEHASDHEIRDFGAGGIDKLNIYTRARVELRARAQTTPDMTLWVEHGKYSMNGIEVVWNGGNSPTFTVPSAGYKRFDLLYFNSVGALTITQGTAVQSSLFTTPNYPTAPTGGYCPVCYVLLSGGQTTITEQSIADARIAWGSLGASAMPAAHDIIGTAHTVSGAAGKLVGLTALNTLGLVDAYTLPTPGTLTVSTTNVASGAHTHAITSSSDVSAGTSALLASNAGALTLSGLTISRSITNPSTTIIPFDTGLTASYTSANSQQTVAGRFVTTLSSSSGITASGAQSASLYFPSVSSSHAGTLTEINSLYVFNNINGGAAGTVQSWYGLRISTGGGANTTAVGTYVGALIGSPTFASGTIVTNAYGIFIQDYTGKYAIYTNAGLNRHGDQVSVVGSADRAQLIVTGYTTQTNPVAQIFRNDGATATVNNVLQIGANSTGTPAAGFGSGLLWTLESSTTADQQAALDTVLWTDATHATRTALRRNSVTGNATTTGYQGFWNHSAVAGTALTVIPNATGDVTEVLTCVYSCAEVTGTDVGGGVAVLAPGESTVICSDATNILTLAVAADGSVTVQRTAGTDTFKVALSMTWI